MKCGCRIIPETEDILYCPKHEAAEDMYTALKMVMDYLKSVNVMGGDYYVEVKRAIDKAEGK